MTDVKSKILRALGKKPNASVEIFSGKNFMGFFFKDIKPRVTEKEMRKIRSELLIHHFTLKELNKVEEIFRGDMYEIRDKDKGIDEAEIDNAIAWMREHENIHHISPEKINILEEKLGVYLIDTLSLRQELFMAWKLIPVNEPLKDVFARRLEHTQILEEERQHAFDCESGEFYDLS